MPNGSSSALKSKSVGRRAQFFRKCSNLILESFLLLEISGQVKEWLIIEMYYMIKMSLVVAYAMVFILLWDRGWVRGVLKHIKTDHF